MIMNEYRLDQMPERYFINHLDIGFCRGQAARQVFDYNPNINLYGVEVDKNNIDHFLEDPFINPDKFVVVQDCLGDGSLVQLNRLKPSTNYCSDVTNSKEGSVLQSKSLSEIVRNYFREVDFSDHSILTIDVEGAEKHLIGRESDEAIMMQFDYIAIEIHHACNSKKYKHFNQNPRRIDFIHWADTFLPWYHIDYSFHYPTSGLGLLFFRKREKFER